MHLRRKMLNKRNKRKTSSRHEVIFVDDRNDGSGSVITKGGSYGYNRIVPRGPRVQSSSNLQTQTWRPLISPVLLFFGIYNAEIFTSIQEVCLLGYWIGYIITQLFAQLFSGKLRLIFKRNDLKPYSLRNPDFTLPTYNTVKYGRQSIRYLGPMLWSKFSKIWSKLDNSSCAFCHLCNTSY